MNVTSSCSHNWAVLLAPLAFSGLISLPPIVHRMSCLFGMDCGPMLSPRAGHVVFMTAAFCSQTCLTLLDGKANSFSAFGAESALPWTLLGPSEDGDYDMDLCSPWGVTFQSFLAAGARPITVPHGGQNERSRQRGRSLVGNGVPVSRSSPTGSRGNC